MQEISIVQEMLKDINECFNNCNDHHTNQQLIGHRDMFRGVVVKEWVIGKNINIIFHAHNKVLVKSIVQFHHECWKRRCVEKSVKIRSVDDHGRSRKRCN